MPARKGGYGKARYKCKECGYRHFFRSGIGQKHYNALDLLQPAKA